MNKTHRWMVDNARFAQLYGDDLLAELVNLHKMWYQIGLLRNKFSGRAEDKMNRLMGDFHDKSNVVISSILDEYDMWVNNHSYDGWWEIASKSILSDTTYSLGGRKIYEPVGVWREINVREQLLDSLSTIMSKEVSDDEWRTQFEDQEFSQGAVAFIKGIVDGEVPFFSGGQDPVAVRRSIADEAKDISDDDSMLTVIREWDLDDEYYEWCLQKELFSKSVDPDLLEMDEQWLEEQVENFGSYLDDDPNLRADAWEQWLVMWPEYEETYNNVIRTIEGLRSVQGSYDVDSIMSQISLALNVAHNTGSMADHIGLENSDLTYLSNLDTSEWESEVKHYAASRWIIAVSSFCV